MGLMATALERDNAVISELLTQVSFDFNEIINELGMIFTFVTKLNYKNRK